MVNSTRQKSKIVVPSVGDVECKFLFRYSEVLLLMCLFRANAKPNWREERKLNAETFGVRSASQYNRRGGYRGYRGRGGGRGDGIQRGGRGMGPNRGKMLLVFLSDL